MSRHLTRVLSLVLPGILLLVSLAAAHCEIPCGIYDDQMRIEMLREHITTIEKSMNQVILLEKDANRKTNQLTRWVMNKEQHADELQEIVSQYFMTQRLKPDAKDYASKLQLLHEMLLAGMKSKQTTDLGQVKRLRELVDLFEKAYFVK
ncbi:MAG: superoxide dismutase, Ni [Desulfuromonadales bacterium]|nr:superoxide dismutase, Ni [Desulfuromonadales bacterium]